MVCSQRQGEVGITGKALNRDLAKDNPERAFSNPRDIVEEVLMTRGEKLATLSDAVLRAAGRKEVRVSG